MLQRYAALMRCFGPFCLMTIFGPVAVPVYAAESAELASKPVAFGPQSATAAENVEEIHDTANAWDAAHVNSPDYPTIRLDGKALMRFRSAAGGYTAVQRCDMVQSRLVTASSGLDYGSLTSVTTAAVGGDSVIYLAGQQLVTVTRADARANGSESAVDLANSWATNLRQALATTSH